MSWVHGPAGYDLLSSRDERLDRAPERPASVSETNGVRWIAPRDGECGGTWVLVNELGVSLALLNGYTETLGREPEAWTSRGRLVTSLADASDGESAVRRLPGLGLAAFQPFVLAILEPGAPARIARWDGRSLALRERADEEMPLVSSGVVAEAARAHRAEVLARLSAGGVDAAVLERFHRSHDGGPSALSPCMHRDDARTRSLCRVSVTKDEVRLVHTPGPPCETASLRPLALERRRAVAS